MCEKDKKEQEKEKEKITIAAVEEFLSKMEQAVFKYIAAKENDSRSEESEARRELNKLLPKFLKYKKWVEQEIKRCIANLEKISAKKAAISTEQTIAKLTDAEDKLLEIYKKLLKVQLKIKIIVRKLKQVFGDEQNQEAPYGSLDELTNNVDEIILMGPVH